MKKYLLLFSIALVTISCDAIVPYFGFGKTSEYVPNSTGSPYELVIVCSNDLWESKVGDTVKNAFQEPEFMLNQPEHRFRILRKREHGFKGIFVKHRNIFMMKVDSTMVDENKAQYVVKYDEWAQPQIVISMKAKNVESLYALYIMKEKEILSLLEEAEQVRFEKILNAFASKEIDTTLRNLFDIGISLPKNYKIRDIIEPEFAWLSYEMPVSSQGVVIYTYPYTGQELNEKELLERRDEFLKRIPGQLAGTYMQSSDSFAPTIEDVNFNGRQWIKMSGFWNVHNDFMGGPYRNYTTIDKKRNRVVSVDCYVYSPDGGKGQRNYIKQLNAVARTVKIY